MINMSATRTVLGSLIIAGGLCGLTTVAYPESCTEDSAAERMTSTPLGTLRLLKDKEQQDWVSIGRVSSEWTGPSNHCSSDCDDYDDDFPRRTSTHRFCFDRVNDPPMLGDKRWVDGASITQVGGPGGHDNNRAAWFSQDNLCLNGRYNARTWATSYEISANAEEFAVLPGYVTDDDECELVFGALVTFEVEKEVVRVRYRVYSAATAEEIDSGVLQDGFKNDLFDDVHVSDIGGSYSYTIRVKKYEH